MKKTFSILLILFLTFEIFWVVKYSFLCFDYFGLISQCFGFVGNELVEVNMGIVIIFYALIMKFQGKS